MNKYINADKLIKDLCDNAVEHFNPIVNSIIITQPFADVVEVKHGHWELDGTCSVCGKHTLQSYGNFCCYCGADMRERGKTMSEQFSIEHINKGIEKLNEIPKQSIADDLKAYFTQMLKNADFVQVVRCKDCKWQVECGRNGESENFFCADGKRRESE